MALRTRAIAVALFVFLTAPVAFAQALMLFPVLDCVTYNAADDSVTAYFGYINKEAAAQDVPFGSYNIFMPAPYFRSQPTHFEVGSYHRVFSVTFPATSYAEWTLGDSSVRATNDPSLYCSGCMSVTGPAGPTGAQGPVGATGATGPTGAVGMDGPQGATGATGAAGMAGVMGPVGSTGPQGPQGATGATGPAGATGAAGPQGLKGDVGPAGATGPQGATGAQGPQGATGAEGVVGPQGNDGVQGPTGPAGTTGATGPAGAQGETGPAGAEGATGAAGAAGPQGAAGPRGFTGAAGSRGPAGLAGFDGRVATRSTYATEPLQIGPGTATILTLTIDATEASTLLVLGNAGCRSSQPVSMRVIIDGNATGASFRSEVLDAVVPIPAHVRTTVAAGRHTVALVVDASAAASVDARVMTAILVREQP